MNNKGFSLIELILVILVAGAIILVMVNLGPAINFLGVGNRELIVRQIVAEQIEDIRSKGFDNLSDGVVAITDPRLASFPQKTATITVSPAATGLKQVDIAINWVENGKTKSFLTSTLVAKGGLK